MTSPPRAIPLLACGALLALGACAPGHRQGTPEPSGVHLSGDVPSLRATALAMDGRVEGGDGSRRLKGVFYAAAPDRFRMEVRGTVGGIALIATGEKGRVRIALPSRRRYAEGALAEDLGSDLIGLPLTGCDLAMVMRISSGMTRFQPCGGDPDDPALDAPPSAADRPGLIVDTSASGGELIRFGFDWTGEGPFPQEVRVEMSGETSALLALTRFRKIAFPSRPADGFFWEPVPPGWAKVSLGALASEEGP